MSDLSRNVNTLYIITITLMSTTSYILSIILNVSERRRQRWSHQTHNSKNIILISPAGGMVWMFYYKEEWRVEARARNAGINTVYNKLKAWDVLRTRSLRGSYLLIRHILRMTVSAGLGRWSRQRHSSKNIILISAAGMHRIIILYYKGRVEARVRPRLHDQASEEIF